MCALWLEGQLTHTCCWVEPAACISHNYTTPLPQHLSTPDDIYADVCLKPALSAAAAVGATSPRRPSAFPASQARQLALMLRGHPAGISTKPMLGENTCGRRFLQVLARQESATRALVHHVALPCAAVLLRAYGSPTYSFIPFCTPPCLRQALRPVHRLGDRSVPEPAGRPAGAARQCVGRAAGTVEGLHPGHPVQAVRCLLCLLCCALQQCAALCAAPDWLEPAAHPFPARHAVLCSSRVRCALCMPSLAYHSLRRRRDVLRSILPLYRELIDAGLRILVYSGDVDAIVPGEGGFAELIQCGGCCGGGGRVVMEGLHPGVKRGCGRHCAG